MFLLFSSVSVALIFVFLNGYGIPQDEAMRSAYTQAYLQDAAKSLFYLDVRTLANVAIDDDILRKDPNAGAGIDKLPCATTGADAGRGCPYWDLSYSADAEDHCDVLSQYYATTVADLLKRDLSDSDVSDPNAHVGSVTGPDDSVRVCLDNRFGLNIGATGPCQATGIVPKAHGKTALRCALKEVMKPLQQAGYYYFAEIVNRVPAEHAIPLNPNTNRITNYWPANEYPAGSKWASCNDVVKYGYQITTANGPQKLSFQVLTVSMPFRAPRANRMDEMRDFVLKICVWPGKN